ncbi:hypothetical protein ABK040_010783 [Willaertia magna]
MKFSKEFNEWKELKDKENDKKKENVKLILFFEKCFTIIDFIYFKIFKSFYNFTKKNIFNKLKKLQFLSSFLENNLLNILIDFFSPIQTFFDTYQNYRGMYNNYSYFNTNDLFITKIFKYLERKGNEYYNKYISSLFNYSINENLLKGLFIGCLLFIWRLMYVYWRFKEKSNLFKSNFIGGNVLDSYIDREDNSLEKHLNRRKELDRLRSSSYLSESFLNQDYYQSPNYYLQNYYHPIPNSALNRERNFFNYFPSYRERIEDLEFRNDDKRRKRTLLGLRRNNNKEEHVNGRSSRNRSVPFVNEETTFHHQQNNTQPLDSYHHDI